MPTNCLAARSIRPNFLEDGVPAPTGLPGYRANQPAFYGHRADPGFPNDVYTANRASWCNYKGIDEPGLQRRGLGITGSRMQADLDFIGRIIDVCNGGGTVAKKKWSVRLDHTIGN